MGASWIAVAALPAAGMAYHALRQAGVRRLNDLERMAILHPNVARELLARVGWEGKVGPLAQRRLAAAMQGVLAANAARQTAGMQQ